MEHLSQYTGLNDEDLLGLYRSGGDNRLLGILLQRYTVLLLGVGMKYLKDREQAQDAVQQVFIKAITHLPQGRVLNFKGWLYVLMRNHCLQLLRDKTYITGEEVLNNLVANETDLQDFILHDQTLEQMNDALQELTGEQKICVSMFYLQGRSYNDIIAHTGFTFTQVKSYIQNGKRNLKIMLLKKMNKEKE